MIGGELGGNLVIYRGGRLSPKRGGGDAVSMKYGEGGMALVLALDRTNGSVRE
jgi:hypothetical protein